MARMEIMNSEDNGGCFPAFCLFCFFPETSPNKTGVLQICSSCSHPEGEEKLEREAGARWIGRGGCRKRVMVRAWSRTDIAN